MTRRDRGPIAEGCIANRDVATFFRDRPPLARSRQVVDDGIARAVKVAREHQLAALLIARASLHYARTIPGKKLENVKFIASERESEGRRILSHD